MNKFEGYKKGINLGGWLSQCVHTKEHYDSFIGESDIEKIASWGMDHVRLPVDCNLFETDGGTGYIDRCIDWCKKHSLNLIIDLHRTFGFSFDDARHNTFLDSAELQERFYRLWEDISARYGGIGGVAFELLNEIDANSVPERWNAIVRTAIERIRAIAPETLILVGGVNGNSIAGIEWLDMPYDDRIVYNFHFYDPLIFTHQSAYWIEEMPRDFRLSYPCSFEKCLSESERNLPHEKNEIYKGLELEKMDISFFDAVIGKAARIAAERGAALYCGEYGVIDLADIDDALRWFADIHAVFEKYGIGHAAWNYKKMDFDLSGSRYDGVREQLFGTQM
ncbi:MAG: cellulase family glycosylhydrolase [Clostridia bacterium]|nr:cellulase family glycosylhydrolase [Clostridia bacterium]